MNIYNRSIDTCVFPDAWKLVYIVPLNKISAPKSMSDTRPIANVSHLAKVFERILANQLTNYLESNSIIDEYQSGFWKHYSTQAALLHLSWDLHVSQISRKVYGTLNNLKYRKNILSTSTRKLLVAAMVIPIIDYCSLVLMDISKRLDYKLQRLINNGIRFIFNLKRDEHITPHR
ncbi:GSCOCG00012740001-RA-CDS, partial [Cotesia congregata]